MECQIIAKAVHTSTLANIRNFKTGYNLHASNTYSLSLQTNSSQEKKWIITGRWNIYLKTFWK